MGRPNSDGRSDSRFNDFLTHREYLCQALVGFGLVLFCITAIFSSASAQSNVTMWSEGKTPDLAIVVQGDAAALQGDVEAISLALLKTTETSNFAVVPTSVDTSVIYINSDQHADPELLDQVENIVETNTTASSTFVLGSGSADVRLRQSIEREALLAVGLVSVVAGAILALTYGWRVGIGVACGLGASATLATILGSLLNPGFNGSVLSTNLPAIAASQIVVAVIGYHATRTPSASGDRRSTMVRSFDVVRGQAFPMAVVIGQLFLVWLFVELFFPPSNPTLSILIGACAGAIVGVALGSLLVEVGGVSFGRPSPRLLDVLREQELAKIIKLSVAGVIVFVTVVGVLNSFGRPSAGSLDQSSLEVRSSLAAELASAGDLTEAIVLTASPKPETELVDRFVVEVSNWPAVQMVQTSSALVRQGLSVDNAEIGRSRPFVGLDTDDSQMVLVVPNGGERSRSTQQLVLDLQEREETLGFRVDGTRLDEVDLERRSGSLLMSLVLISCLAALVAALAVGGSPSTVLLFFATRLFLLLGSIGIGSALVSAGSVDELVLVVLVVSIALGWFEVSYWTSKERGTFEHRSVSSPRYGSVAYRMRTPMRSSSAGFCSLAAIGSAWMFADAPFIRPIGMAFVVVPAVVTAAINVLLPAVLRYGSTFGSEWSLSSLTPNKLTSVGPSMLAFATQPLARQRARPAKPSRLRPLARSTGFEPSLTNDREESPIDAVPDGSDLEIDEDIDEVAPSTSEVTESPESSDDQIEDDRQTDSTPEPIDGFSDLTIVGEGGFAVVYRAVDSAGSVVALKVLTTTNSESGRRRFDREKDALEALSEVDGVVELLGSGVTEGGSPYLVLSYLEGGTIANGIRNQPYNWHEAYELGCKLAETLAACHRRGVFHRDLKPSNVLLDADGQPHLLDFGSTEIVDGRSLSSRPAFTPNYSPPEVLAVGNKGSDGGLVDVYGLGVLLWSMVAGRRPFVSDDSDSDEIPTIFNRVATEELAPLTGVPNWFRDVVEKAVDKRASRRFGSVAEMHTALVKRSLLEGPQKPVPEMQAGQSRSSKVRRTSKAGFIGLFARRSSDGRNPSPERPKPFPSRTRSNVDWSAEASRLILADFQLASSPGDHSVDEVYAPGTEVYEMAQEMRSHYLEAGHKIIAEKPMVLTVNVINTDAPVRLEVEVAHPPYVLLDADGSQLESHPFERRRSDLWLVETDAGYRISTIALRASEQYES